MNESERLARELDKALNGEAWHGPSWRELLEGLPRAAALARPLPSAHTIAEILAHATTWHEVVTRRLAGESPTVSDAEDWPPAAPASDGAWAAMQERFFASGAVLRERIAGFPPDRLQSPRPGVQGTWHHLISGELQHDVYHAGQVALLKKATATPVA